MKENQNTGQEENAHSAEEVGPFKSMEALFAMLQEQADHEHVSANHAVSSVPFTLRMSGEIKQYIFRINPALLDNGKLSVVSLDLYGVEIDYSEDDEEDIERLKPLQQWIVRATWIDGKPKISDDDIDATVIQIDGNIIGLSIVAEHARIILQQRFSIKKNIASNKLGMPVMSQPSSIN
jgi:hypothetical protein